MQVRFGEFTLDRSTRQLRRGEAEVHLEPKAFELLSLLVQRRPSAVSKPEIRDILWPGTFVSDSSLTGLIAQIRAALGDDRRRSRYLRTVHGFGYAFVAASEPAPPETTPPTEPRVIWDRRVTPLAPGENVIGRHEEASVFIDAPSVSRRHARIVVDGERAVLEDLGSKNGTFLGNERLEGPRVLEDGDAFRLGRMVLVYRSAARSERTKTEDGAG